MKARMNDERIELGWRAVSRLSTVFSAGVLKYRCSSGYEADPVASEQRNPARFV